MEKALRKMEGVVGSQNVITDPELLDMYSVNMLSVDNIMPAAVVRPGSVEEIQAILKIANEYKTPLWTLSGGQSHGYGLVCAAKPGTIILELKRMNRILEVNVDLAYALVEPGVTFLQLYQYLKENNIPLWIDAPSGSPHSSCLGNITERGAGYNLWERGFSSVAAWKLFWLMDRYFEQARVLFRTQRHGRFSSGDTDRIWMVFLRNLILELSQRPVFGSCPNPQPTSP